MCFGLPEPGLQLVVGQLAHELVGVEGLDVEGGVTILGAEDVVAEVGLTDVLDLLLDPSGGGLCVCSWRAYISEISIYFFFLLCRRLNRLELPKLASHP